MQAPPLSVVPQGSPLPRILPAPPPSVGGPSPVAPPASPSGAVPAVDVAITSVTLVGATAYPSAELTALAGDLVGPAVPLARVEAGRLAILNRYRADGYVVTTVSASLDGQGRLRLVVVEGRIVDVKTGLIGPKAAR